MTYADIIAAFHGACPGTGYALQSERGRLLEDIAALEAEVGEFRMVRAWLGQFSHEMTLDDLEVPELRQWKLVLLDVEGEMNNEVMG